MAMALCACGVEEDAELEAESAAILLQLNGRLSNVLVNVGVFC